MENGTCSDDPWKFWGANPIEQMAAQLPPESQALLKGLIYDWNVVFVPSGNQVRGGTFHASIALRDRGLLTDGFRVLIQVQDKNGNYNAVEKEGTLEKNLAQKAGEWVADAVNAVVRGFIAWLVETIGTIAGIIIGILAGIIKSIIDMIVGLVDMIIHLPEMLGVIGQIGSIFGSIGQVFLAMVGGWIGEAEWVMPQSWGSECGKPEAQLVLDLVVGKFQNTSSANVTCKRTEYAKNYVIGAIAGFIIGMLIGGGIAGALKALKTINGFKQVANKVEKALDAGKDAARAANGVVKSAAKGAGKSVSGGTTHLTVAVSRAFGAISEDASAFFLPIAKRFRKELREAFERKPEAGRVTETLAALSKPGKLADPADANRMLKRGLGQADDPSNWKGFVNEVEMTKRYADNLPEGWKLKIPPEGRGIGRDIEILDDLGNLRGMRDFKHWSRGALDNGEAMAKAANHAKIAAQSKGLSTFDNIVEFNLKGVAHTADDIARWSEPFQRLNVGVLFVWD